ncbi:ranBP-type and C3HC4-type zinc finger-containing protein 1 [Caerostris extrusa]|uniref:RanBP-type and C3HC4-type zinc finger-containing protein 1 n=1 Tax=Caerostris extrusa TaxID=172846 RepID=A0AAV4N4G6_CAEEX|nr:ranBP-type and C3HC4-type zinc finger-containing protein 1 [Caerostris extrusa]
MTINKNREEQKLNRLSNGSIDGVERRDSQKDRRSNKVVSKTVKSTTGVAYSAPIQKRYKKRKAPPPPTMMATVSSAIYASVCKKDSKNIQNGIASSKYNDFKDSSVKQKHNRIQRKNSNEWNYQSSTSKASKHRSTRKQLRRLSQLSDYTNSKTNYLGSGSNDSSSGSILFSPDESSDEKYGLVNYKAIKTMDGIDKETSVPRSSNFVQYAGDNSDVCLKISIQKTETNVVTVEEVPASHTVHYTIEEDTSSSELSDEPPAIPVKIKAIDAVPESKTNSTDSSVTSTEESGEKSNTVFDELKIKPPVKGSVKDFVYAFNMLAAKVMDLEVNLQK